MDNSKKYYELATEEECRAEIKKIIDNTNDLWILWQIYRTAVNITK